MSQLVLNVPGTPKEAEVEIQGLGVFPNGSTTTLTAEQVEAYDNYCSVHGLEEPAYPMYVGDKPEKEKATLVGSSKDKVPVDGNKEKN